MNILDSGRQGGHYQLLESANWRGSVGPVPCSPERSRMDVARLNYYEF